MWEMTQKLEKQLKKKKDLSNTDLSWRLLARSLAEQSWQHSDIQPKHLSSVPA